MFMTRIKIASTVLLLAVVGLGIATPPLQGLPPWFKDLDKDGDRQIGLHEWRKGGKQLNDFLVIDLNGDGFITEEEVLLCHTSDFRCGNVEAATFRGAKVDSIVDFRSAKGRPHRSP